MKEVPGREVLAHHTLNELTRLLLLEVVLHVLQQTEVHVLALLGKTNEEMDVVAVGIMRDEAPNRRHIQALLGRDFQLREPSS